jgi:hypothetical protein
VNIGKPGNSGPSSEILLAISLIVKIYGLQVLQFLTFQKSPNRAFKIFLLTKPPGKGSIKPI